MALTRNDLKNMGLDPEIAGKIISMHVDTINDIKDERDKYKADAEKLPEVQRQLEKANKDLAAMADEGWEQKYKDVQKALDDLKADNKAKEARSAKSAEYKRLIIEAGIPEKRAASILRISDKEIESLKLDKDGKAENAADVIKALKADFADFVVTTEEKGADTPTPPANGDTKGLKTREEIMKMKDRAAQQAEIEKILASGKNFFDS